MKRIIISIAIIAMIAAAGSMAILYIGEANSRLLGQLELVEKAYSEGGDTAREIALLSRSYKSLRRVLGIIADDDDVEEVGALISRLLPMLESDCDEFLAECRMIRSAAAKIYSGELPTLDKIL